MNSAFFQKLKSSKWIGTLAKVALSALAFWLAFRNVDFSSLPGIVHGQKASGLVIAVLAVTVQTSLGGLRWRQILRALSESGRHVISAWEAFKLFYIGAFFNCCLPGTVGGDVVRVWLAKSDHIPMSLSINSVVIDRLIALIALGVLVTVTLPLLGSDAGFNPLPWVLAAVAGIAVGIWLLFNLERVLKPWEHIRPVRWVLYLIHCLRLLFKYRMTSLMSLLYALVSHISFCMSAWGLALSMGVDISILQCITLVPWVLLIAILPISIGGWGMREASLIGLFSMIGVAKAQSLAISVELGLLAILMSLPAGFLWLTYRKNKPMQKEGLL